MRFRGLNAFTIKIIACVTMVLDHVGLLFFPDALFLREVGRLTFPLFAFLLTEGVIRTSDAEKYTIRLALFAIISQLPYVFMLYTAGMHVTELNIFFLLALGVGMLMAVRQTKNMALKIAIIVAIAAVAQLTSISYGAYGIVIIAACYLLRQNNVWLGVGLFVGATVFVTTITGHYSWMQLYALFSLPIMALYNHQPGPKVSRWWFYWFYPIHLVVLSSLAFFIHALR